MIPADDAAVAAALAALPESTTVVVDFDGTLLRGNSTQLYLRSLRPRMVAAGMLSLLELLQPWRLLPGGDARWLYRDWLRVVVLSVLLPWSPVLWRRQAATIARRHAETGLIAAIAAAPQSRIVVATYGFRFLVAPVLRALPGSAQGWPLLVAAPLLSAFRLRRVGKAHVVRDRLGADAMAGSVLITDSEDDRDFGPLNRATFIVARESDAPEPVGGSYLPLQYMHHCKRPGENTIVRTILFYDLAALLLAYAVASPRPLMTAVGLVCFQLAFWTIYELGNWENDVLGEVYEDKPHVPAGLAAWRDRVRPARAWVWAAALSVPAALLLAGGPAAPAMFAFLLAYLLASRACYALYNRTDPKTRVFLYPAMQLSKAAGLALVLPAAPAGLILVVTVVLVRQLRYLIYRYGETRLAFAIPVNLHTLLCYVLLIGMSLCLTGSQDRAFWATAGLVAVWHVQRARRDIASVLRGIVWLPARHRDALKARAPAQP